MSEWTPASDAADGVRLLAYHKSWGRPHFAERVSGEWRVEWTDGLDGGPMLAEDPSHVMTPPELPAVR